MVEGPDRSEEEDQAKGSAEANDTTTLNMHAINDLRRSFDEIEALKDTLVDDKKKKATAINEFVLRKLNKTVAAMINMSDNEKKMVKGMKEACVVKAGSLRYAVKSIEKFERRMKGYLANFDSLPTRKRRLSDAQVFIDYVKSQVKAKQDISSENIAPFIAEIESKIAIDKRDEAQEKIKEIEQMIADNRDPKIIQGTINTLLEYIGYDSVKKRVSNPIFQEIVPKAIALAEDVNRIIKSSTESRRRIKMELAPFRTPSHKLAKEYSRISAAIKNAKIDAEIARKNSDEAGESAANAKAAELRTKLQEIQVELIEITQKAIVKNGVADPARAKILLLKSLGKEDENNPLMEPWVGMVVMNPNMNPYDLERSTKDRDKTSAASGVSNKPALGINLSINKELDSIELRYASDPHGGIGAVESIKIRIEGIAEKNPKFARSNYKKELLKRANELLVVYKERREAKRTEVQFLAEKMNLDIPVAGIRIIEYQPIVLVEDVSFLGDKRVRATDFQTAPGAEPKRFFGKLKREGNKIIATSGIHDRDATDSKSFIEGSIFTIHFSGTDEVMTLRIVAQKPQQDEPIASDDPGTESDDPETENDDSGSESIEEDSPWEAYLASDVRLSIEEPLVIMDLSAFENPQIERMEVITEPDDQAQQFNWGIFIDENYNLVIDPDIYTSPAANEVGQAAGLVLGSIIKIYLIDEDHVITINIVTEEERLRRVMGSQMVEKLDVGFDEQDTTTVARIRVEELAKAAKAEAEEARFTPSGSPIPPGVVDQEQSSRSPWTPDLVTVGRKNVSRAILVLAGGAVLAGAAALYQLDLLPGFKKNADQVAAIDSETDPDPSVTPDPDQDPTPEPNPSITPDTDPETSPDPIPDITPDPDPETSPDPIPGITPDPPDPEEPEHALREISRVASSFSPDLKNKVRDLQDMLNKTQTTLQELEDWKREAELSSPLNSEEQREYDTRVTRFINQAEGIRKSDEASTLLSSLISDPNPETLQSLINLIESQKILLPQIIQDLEGIVEALKEWKREAELSSPLNSEEQREYDKRMAKHEGRAKKLMAALNLLTSISGKLSPLPPQ